MDLEINIPNYSKKKTVKFSEAICESVHEALAKGKLDELFVYTNVNNEKSYIEAIKYILVFGIIPEIKRDKEYETEVNESLEKLLLLYPDKQKLVNNIILISEALAEENKVFKINWYDDLYKEDRVMTYYAHSRMKYNTEVEEYELSLIKDDYIINPNGTVDQTLPTEEIMVKCFDLISKCNKFVFSTVNGTIGKGLYQELFFAMKEKKKIFIIENHEIKEIKTLFINPIKNSKNDKIYATVKVEEYENEENDGK